ncbi:cap-specific mRNA (nucleoside-2'-O-)-methyltransferase 2 [Octopus bimaculoides]|uniref:cap-specific mRNA (nucleoside-2'-O-)-methyltransferase 2 n=1 Tax=Octopus bimaculoides TaxID=37653 RepID=UPI00071D917E|nr:cap-specific mRNA (nucleoside-2'-O-)-methyltransferase 2 [Octopus bimaculoides]|eukprot:XP_014768108.1 PREDICTED: cap-specific mRNA (nucleoside-2'-O-)-methyltransferase 2-like [Octopus bimaculoides]
MATILKTIQGKADKVKRTTNSYIDDVLVDESIVLAKKWHAHTTNTHLGGSVCGNLRYQIRPELCTQAWCKFMEILSTYSVVDLKSKKLNSVHLCEAPGSFITCLNHFLFTHGFTGKWQWMASTLNPYYEGNNLGNMIADDRFIRATLPHWQFCDGTGDLLDKNNCNHLCKTTHNMEIPKLVTADGSIDCQNNPSMQESIVSQLHYCETFAALKLLGKGGSFVIKFFTMFENNTIGLMYLLVKFFEQVNVFKPATSKAGNSEVYVVCLNFLGLKVCPQEDFLTNLECLIFNQSTFDGDIWNMSSVPPSFIEEHINCCRLFHSLQQSAIQRNLSLFKEIPEGYHYKRLNVLRDRCFRDYMSHYKISPLQNGSTVVNAHDKYVYGKTFQSINFQYKHEGSFAERMDNLNLSWRDRLKLIDVSKYKPTNDYAFVMKDASRKRLAKNNLKFLSGKPLSVIRNSRLCNPKLIELLNGILDNCDLTNTNDDFDQEVIADLSTTMQRLFTGHCSSICCLAEDFDFFSKLQIQDLKIFGREEENKSHQQLTLIVNVTSPTTLLGKGEILDKMLLLTKVSFALQKLKADDNLLLLTHSFLTRFSAGLLLLAYDCFQKIAIFPTPCAGTLKQLVLLSDFTSCPGYIAKYLQVLVQTYERHGSSQERDVLEIVPMKILNKDVEFFSELMKSNENLLKCFIFTKLNWEKEHV